MTRRRPNPLVPPFDLSLGDLRIGPMRLAELLEAHDHAQRHTRLSEVLGDGHLYSRIGSYRAIRDVFVGWGGRFENNPRPEYVAMPFAGLPGILTAWAVPFVDNVTLLRKLDQRAARPLLVQEAMHPALGLAKNFLLHEASHCILDRLAPLPKLERGLASERAVVYRMFMGEAFANTTAALCLLDIRTKHDLAFYALNDYGYALAPTRADLVKRAVDRFGFTFCFRAMFVGFLIGKFLAVGIGADQVSLVLSAIAPDVKTKRSDLSWLAELMSSLMTGQVFLYHLNTFYFKISGMRTPLTKLIAFDPVDALVNDDALSAAFISLGELVQHGVNAPVFEQSKKA